ncbi:cytochrome P450 [Frankia sp. AgB32]|uniref:cytochrome P450 n=1 Tax=Frankia sp. AgB32 TaxID=631119 RepID=UPI0020105834|nr:cytochrome P450 [Frankia sp. AgB32]MCK9897881.1 cytochrome P450 [Frankia sp. AgB32]
MADIRADPLGFLIAMAARYGPVSQHRTERDTVVMVSDPGLAARVLRAGEDRYTKEGTPDDAMLTPLLGEGLLTSHGEAWRRQRRMTVPMFRRRRVEAFAPMMVRQATALAERWLAVPAGQPVRVDHDLSALTLTVVANALVGGDLSGIGPKFGAAVDAVNSFMSHGDPAERPRTETIAAHESAYPKARRVLDGIVWTLVECRMAAGDPGAAGDVGGDPPDLLSALVAARDPATNQPLGQREIREQVMTMLMAGHETTAKALTWSLYLLDRHPQVAGRARREIAAALGGRPPTVADLSILPWCQVILAEAMRLFPPVWVISRRAVVDDTLAGYAVPAGALVCVSPWVLHRDAARWPDPDVFDPVRFAERDGASRSADGYLPFGLGPRRCIGRGFALMEAQLVLATLLQRVEMRLVPEHQVEPQALVTLRPAHGMWMTASPAPV